MDSQRMNTSEHVWKEYHTMLRAFIQSKVSDNLVVDDILQDVFLKMHTGLTSLNDKTKIKSWLYQITRNTIIDHYRAQKPGNNFPEDIPEPESDPSEEVLQELSACLHPMIQLLPDSNREAIIMSEIHGLTQKEVAEKQGISLSGAKSRIQRGRARLKEMLDECCRYEFDKVGRLSNFQPRKTDCSIDC